jgi:branched-chain amino acid transport system substrate-binding protein
MRRRTFLAAAGNAAATLPFRASAQSRLELVLGQTAALSGPFGEQVKRFNEGARLVFDQVNAAGGVMGRRLQLVSIDDQLQPEKAAAAATELVQKHKAVALFGCVGTPTTAALEPVLRATGVPAIGGYAVADSVREKCKGAAYFVRAGYGREAEALVQHISTVGIRRVGVAHLAHAGGEEALRQIRDALAAYKLDVTVSAAVTTDGLNVTEAAKKLGALKPDAIVMFLGGTLAAGLMQAVGQLGVRSNYYGLSVVPGEQVAAKLGARVRGLILSQTMSYPWHATEPAAIDFRRKAQAGKVELNYTSYEGYVNARVMVEALYRCSTDLSASRLHTVMSNMRWHYAGLDLDFSLDGHTGSRFVELVQMTEQGRYLR